MSRFWQNFITNGGETPAGDQPLPPPPADDSETLDAFSHAVIKVADTLLTPDQQSVNHIAHRLKGQLSQLHLEKNAIPLFGPILGVVLIVAGVLLLRGPRKRRAAVQAAPAMEHEETAAP